MRKILFNNRPVCIYLNKILRHSSKTHTETIVNPDGTITTKTTTETINEDGTTNITIEESNSDGTHSSTVTNYDKSGNPINSTNASTDVDGNINT